MGKINNQLTWIHKQIWPGELVHAACNDGPHQQVFQGGEGKTGDTESKVSGVGGYMCNIVLVPGKRWWLRASIANIHLEQAVPEAQTTGWGEDVVKSSVVQNIVEIFK